MKKCPPGVICIENLTMFFVIIAIILVNYFTDIKNTASGIGNGISNGFSSVFGSFGNLFYID